MNKVVILLEILGFISALLVVLISGAKAVRWIRRDRK